MYVNVFPDVKRHNTVKIDKIDELGNYVPFLAYSIISMCDITPKLIELYKVFNSSPISKYYKPLNYTTYHMTVFNLWNQREKLYPYQVDQSGRAPKSRDSITLNHVMKPAFFKMANKIKEFKDLNEIHVSVSKIKRTSTGIVMDVQLMSSVQIGQIKSLRSWCVDNFYNSDAKLKFHISFGYLYKKVEEDLTQPIFKLEEWIKENIPDIVVRRPSPTIFLSGELSLGNLRVNPLLLRRRNGN
ncbi:unnamed protein product [Mytilus edulis]|uniref:DUF1868 domain-containing protein n=1 Tax=Mytilus edulis TaxID=6550 RepID=A0A8S3UCS1_MYTED|nr:unnamed protein product [Mytilus edulis]